MVTDINMTLDDLKKFGLNLLPTAGAIGGGIAGGAAAGPFGAIPAAGAGASGGEYLRQLLSGEQLNPTEARKQAALGVAGEGIGIPVGNLLSKALGTGAKGLMKTVFKESPKLERAGIKSGTTLAEQALQAGERGTTTQIYQKALSTIKTLEDTLQKTLSEAKQKVKLSEVRKEVEPLIKKYTEAGNEAAANFITKRLDAIKNVSGSVMSAEKAQAIKRTLYEELRKAYGDIAAPNKEELKAVGRGFKKAIEKAGGVQVENINKQLSYYGKIADTMESKLAKSGGSFLDKLVMGGGILSAPFTGGASLLAPAVMGVAGSTIGKTTTAQALKGLGQVAAKPAAQAIGGQAMARTGNALMELLVGKQPPQDSNQTGDQNNLNQGTNIIPQGTSTAPKEGDISPQGQWVYSEQAKDWIPNTQTQAGGVPKDMFSEESLQQLAIMDLMETGGKNFAKIDAMKKMFSGVKQDRSQMTEAQVARAQTGDLTDEALSLLTTKPNIKTGLIEAPLESLKAKVNKGDQDTIDFNILISNLTATLAKARAGTSFTPNEQKMLERYAPKVGDSKQELLTKLKGLKSMGLNL